MRKIALTAAVVLAPALSSTLMLAAPAHAEARSPGPEASHTMTSTTKDAPGGFSFRPRGDRVTVCDLSSDDKGVRVRVKNVTKDPDATEYTLTVGGNGDCVTKGASDGQPWNLAEKHCFRFTMWLVKGEDRVSPKQWWQYRNYNNDGPKPCPGVG